MAIRGRDATSRGAFYAIIKRALYTFPCVPPLINSIYLILGQAAANGGAQTPEFLFRAGDTRERNRDRSRGR